MTDITTRGLLAVVLPIILTGIVGVIDNSLRWRAEMNQKQFDRQTRIMDKVMDISDPAQRKVVAQFYLGTGLFVGSFKSELELAVSLTDSQIVATAEPPMVAASSTALEDVTIAAITPFEFPTDIDYEALTQKLAESQSLNVPKTIFSFEGSVMQPTPVPQK